MSKLSERARNQPCTIRLAGCDGGGDTTVLAHYRLLALGAGMGRKPHDIFGAYACVHCHDAVDGRRTIPECDRTHVRLAHLEGVLKTIHLLMVGGKLKV